MRIAINGFGRIGRLVLRRLAQTTDAEVVVINDLAADDALTYLFRYDSVHGRQKAALENGHLRYGDFNIAMTAERNPEALNWGDRGVDVVIEATGAFLTREAATRHLTSGAKRVLITAPAVEPDRTIVMGVNDDDLLESDQIVSNASCTTNCLAPVAKVFIDNFGVESLAFTTIHAYTSSQALVDVPMKKVRRGRAAAMSMIPTSTGAAKAVAAVTPELKGRTHGMAVRVPTPDGSLTDMVVRFTNPPRDVATLNNVLLEASRAPLMQPVLEVSSDELVSIDVIGNDHSSIVDSLSTARITDDLVKVLSWYDNEWGYSCRVVDLARKMQGLAPVGF